MFLDALDSFRPIVFFGMAAPEHCGLVLVLTFIWYELPSVTQWS